MTEKYEKLLEERAAKAKLDLERLQAKVVKAESVLKNIQRVHGHVLIGRDNLRILLAKAQKAKNVHGSELELLKKNLDMLQSRLDRIESDLKYKQSALDKLKAKLK